MNGFPLMNLRWNTTWRNKPFEQHTCNSFAPATRRAMHSSQNSAVCKSVQPEEYISELKGC